MRDRIWIVIALIGITAGIWRLTHRFIAKPAAPTPPTMRSTP